MKKAGLAFFFLFNFLAAIAQVKLPDPEHLNGMHPSDCNRATPGKIINDSLFPGTKFVLAKDSMNGYTWVNFKNSDKLLIIDCGCSDFTWIFQFTTNRFSADTSDIKYWYLKASELLKVAAKGVYAGSIFDIKKSADTLITYSKNYPDSIKLNKEIYFYKGAKPEQTDDSDEATEMQEMTPHFFISRVEKLSANEYMVEVTFSVGL